MSAKSDEQQNAVLSWTKALTKNKEIVVENTNKLIPSGSKLNLKNTQIILDDYLNKTHKKHTKSCAVINSIINF